MLIEHSNVGVSLYLFFVEGKFRRSVSRFVRPFFVWRFVLFILEASVLFDGFDLNRGRFCIDEQILNFYHKGGKIFVDFLSIRC